MNRPDHLRIACTLDGEELACRTAWIRQLADDALESHVRHGAVLHLVYADHARERVREMIAQERICCAFLRFDLRDEKDRVRLTIRAPDGASPFVDKLFDEFLGLVCGRTVLRQQTGNK